MSKDTTSEKDMTITQPEKIKGHSEADIVMK